jgi:hypothetical protein
VAAATSPPMAADRVTPGLWAIGLPIRVIVRRPIRSSPPGDSGGAMARATSGRSSGTPRPSRNLSSSTALPPMTRYVGVQAVGQEGPEGPASTPEPVVQGVSRDAKGRCEMAEVFVEIVAAVDDRPVHRGERGERGLNALPLERVPQGGMGRLRWLRLRASCGAEPASMTPFVVQSGVSGQHDKPGSKRPPRRVVLGSVLPRCDKGVRHRFLDIRGGRPLENARGDGV